MCPLAFLAFYPPFGHSHAVGDYQLIYDPAYYPDSRRKSNSKTTTCSFIFETK
ncbi:hypothetical protein FA13DRAFT_1728712 [Coprinellus micaceus]|uniref:Uncharacterized protein n=1 Tax=Coprinellus micaceus TaxID=71717 RepID=A0A4Y7TMV8_COPMI|nr:hypothetical protein FA13DRAFT_1728712 [Coprinellus micaceus]